MIFLIKFLSQQRIGVLFVSFLLLPLVLFNGCTKDDEPSEPSDFFTLIVDPSFDTSTKDHWILASSTAGLWIDVQPFEAGEVKILHGVVPDLNTFTLHFMEVTETTDGRSEYILTSYGQVAVNGQWILKSPDPVSPPSYALTVQVSNVAPSNRPTPNDIVILSSDAGLPGGYSGSISGSNVSLNTRLQKSVADIFLTVYQNDDPYYREFQGIILPDTLTVDASADVQIADRIYTLNLPENEYFLASIEAFNKDQPYRHTMAEFYDLDGGTSVKLGYNQGYDLYRTSLSYKSGNTLRNYAKVASAVDENLSLPPFQFSVTGTSADDFECESDLAYDVSATYFRHFTPEMDIRWNYIQPRQDASPAIRCRIEPFPPDLQDAYPVLPDPGLINYLYVSGYQYREGPGYQEMITTQSQSGRISMDMFAFDTYYHFQQRAQ
jgi:hypothetical protein